MREAVRCLAATAASITSQKAPVCIVAALIVQGGHLPADLHLGAVGVGEVLKVQAGRQLPVNLVL